jgi:hypothetical protein
MCIKNWFKPSTVQTLEEIIKTTSAGMSDKQKAAYAKEIDDLNFKYNLSTPVQLVEITAAQWAQTAQVKYPTLKTDMENESFQTCTEEELQRILSLDWTNLITYSKFFNCDNYAELLTSRLTQEYGIASAVEVWGWAGRAYHGFNLVVLKKGNGWEAKLIEPQTDKIFDFECQPLGLYQPEKTK